MNGEEPTLDQPATNSASYLRRLEKSVAVLSKIAGASVFATVGSFCAVLALLPLKQTETVFVSMTNGAQIVRLLPEQIDRSTLEQYIRSTLTEYVEKRETINFVDDDERFKWVQTFTHPQWFRLFAEHMSSGNPDSPLVYYAKNELTRDVFVQSLEQIPDADDVWRAEYVATDRKSGVKVRTKTFVATFKARLAGIEASAAKTGINPFGLIVEIYAVSVKGNPKGE